MAGENRFLHHVLRPTSTDLFGGNVLAPPLVTPEGEARRTTLGKSWTGPVEFWSSIEYGTFLRGLVRELQAAGCPARQRFVIGEQPYREARTLLARLKIRMRAYAWYPIRLQYRMLFEARPAALVVCSNTFYTPALAMAATWRSGIPVIHWVYDLYPDALVEARTVKAGGVPAHLLAKLTRFTLRSSAANVFIGERLRKHAHAVYPDLSPSCVIPIGTDGERFRDCPPRARDEQESLRLLYCGNMGRLHDTGTIIGLLERGVPEGWHVAIRGHGAHFESLAHGAGLRTDHAFSLGPTLGENQWKPVMLSADAALVSVRPGAERVLLPSKVYSALAAGQAIVAICPAESDLADIVRQHDVGWVIEPGDAGALHALLGHLRCNPAELLTKRTNAFRVGHGRFDQRALIEPWMQLLQRVAASPQPAVAQGQSWIRSRRDSEARAAAAGR